MYRHTLSTIPSTCRVQASLYTSLSLQVHNPSSASSLYRCLSLSTHLFAKKVTNPNLAKQINKQRTYLEHKKTHSQKPHHAQNPSVKSPSSSSSSSAVVADPNLDPAKFSSSDGGGATPWWIWRKLPPKEKFAHLGQNVFHLVPPAEGDLASPSFDLLSGVQARNLFKNPATIHRIIATETDLAREAQRDNDMTAEVVLVGRSNVGKSSLLNALLKNGGNRKQLATTSKTPGRTQLLFMFSFKNERNLRLVDCPGYGFATAKLERVEKWNLLMGLYLRRRAAQGILRRVMVLIDIRRGVGPLDEEFMKFLEGEAIPYQVILTKVDTVTPKQFERQLAQVRKHLQSMPQGLFGNAETRAQYEQQMRTQGDQQLEEEDPQWKEEVESGKYETTSSLPSDPSAVMPTYSCSIPIIHTVSSREGLGVQTLQQSLTRMMTMEKNVKQRAYMSDEDLRKQEEAALTEEAFGDDDFDEEVPYVGDGMDNEAEEEGEDSHIPPIPVSHYDTPAPDAGSTSFLPSSKRKSFGLAKKRGTSGQVRRGFATSAKKSRAASPAAGTETPKKKASKKKSEAAAAAAEEAGEIETVSASKKKASNAHSASVSDNTTGTTTSKPTTKSDIVTPSASTGLSSSSSDAHLATMYQKKSQRQHILDRSETYIGSMHHQQSAQWVYSESKEGDKLVRKIVQRECVFVPSLVHIFDEILVNAADNQHRVSKDEAKLVDATAASQLMTTIRVDIDEKSGRISVFNDGASIPIAVHPTEGIPIPELIFGHLLTSSNYNDKEQRFTGGRHGYGAKLTNIFSEEFIVEIQDVARGKRYTQKFKKNMSETTPPTIEEFATLIEKGESKKNLQNNFTRITFVPDYARFDEKGLTPDTIAIMKKRVVDIAACVNTNIIVAKSHEKAKRKANQEEEAETSSGVKRIKVYLNGSLVEVESFNKYLDLFPQAVAQVRADQDADDEDGVIDGKWVFANVNSNWQIAVGPNVSLSTPLLPTSTANSALPSTVFTLPPATRDISFVNSIYTSRGGTHVNHVADKICKAIIDHILRTNKQITREMIPPQLVKSHMSLLVNCKIPNPSFSSQTKESLMTPVRDFGSDCALTTTFLNQITSNATGIVPAIIDAVSTKQQMELLKKSKMNAQKSRGKYLNIPKLDDAHWAGSNDPEKVKQTTLILTEGDSAKALVLSSLSILGRDKYGVFPLKGKLLNVRDASLKQVMENAEIQNILAIVGLEIGAKYDVNGMNSAASNAATGTAPTKRLRYGRIMLMTDQDHDGSHIKGLFLNLLHTYWPELLQSNSFLEEFITAIIKVKINKSKQTLQFHTQREYEEWKNGLPGDLSTNTDKFKKYCTVKYYKGLGTNTSEEGKEYFRNIQKHRVKFVWGLGLNAPSKRALPAAAAAGSAESNNTLTLLPPTGADSGAWIRLAFSKDQSNARKEWLTKCYNSSLYVDTRSMVLPIDEFINKELIVFSHADNIRSIPALFDGLKPVQRKILYGCFKKHTLLKSEIKVAQLSGYISEQTMYHHGEMSLQGSIINMAQSFIGSNNINLLLGSGQFGSRNTGGKDAAAARYIYTKLSPLTRLLFHPHDDALFTYKDEDGFLVEPEFYLPVLPMVLVNGAEGIGTGFSTFVPTYNPSDLIHNIRAILQQPQDSKKSSATVLKEMHPWIRGWLGKMTPHTYLDTSNDDKEKIVASYMSEGLITKTSSSTFEITELPVGRWPEEYKSFLASMQSSGEIKRFYDQGTDERVHYKIEVSNLQMQVIESENVMKFFKLISPLSVSNMHLFDGFGIMRKFRSPLEILREFVSVRLEYYRRRHEHLLIALEADYARVNTRMSFIDSVISGKLVVYNRKKTDLVSQLATKGFKTSQQLLPRFPVYESHLQGKPIKFVNAASSSSSSHGSESDTTVEKKDLLENDSYDFLLNMPLSSLTAERLASLKSEQDSIQHQLVQLKKSDARSLWLHDLQKLEETLNSYDRKRSSKSSMKIEVVEDEEESD